MTTTAAITREELLDFLRSFRYAIQSTVQRAAANDDKDGPPDGAPSPPRPQSAIVGVAVSDAMELVFDTTITSRKAVNLRDNPAIAFCFGSTAATAQSCVQMEGVADELIVSTTATTTDHAADEDNREERLRHLYFEIFPDGRDRANTLPEGIAYFCVRPTWLRFSDYTKDPPRIVELDGDMLRQLA
jgi:hypothetical protein